LICAINFSQCASKNAEIDNRKKQYIINAVAVVSGVATGIMTNEFLRWLDVTSGTHVYIQLILSHLIVITGARRFRAINNSIQSKDKKTTLLFQGAHIITGYVYMLYLLMNCKTQQYDGCDL